MKLPNFARNRAKRLVESKEELKHFLSEAREKASKVSFAELDNAKLLINLAAAVWNGTYKDVEKKTYILVVGAIVYFLMPLDLVPDVIFVLGYLDDAAVVAWVVAAVKDELEKFKEWDKTPRNGPIDGA